MININYTRANKFIRGPISLHQLFEFSKYGINAVRIFMYIRMQEGKLVSKGLLSQNQKVWEHAWIKLDNKNCEQTVGLHKTHKWDKLRTLEQKGLIELRTGAGRSPEAKIIIPTMH